MARNFNPNVENLARMREMINLEVPFENIALELRCTVRTVENWERRFNIEELGEGIAEDRRRYGNGGREKITDEQLQQVVNLIQNDPFQPVCKIPETLGINVNEKTLRNALKQRAGIVCRKAAKKTRLTQPNFNDRIRFAQRYGNWNPAQWRRTIFMDEKVFSTEKDGRSRVWRPNRTRYDQRYVLENARSGRSTQAYWGWVNGDGPGSLIRIDRRLTAALYVNILQEHLLPSIYQRYEIDDDVIYIVEDNSPIHTARIVQQWYHEHPRFQRLTWPPRSPDLNIIENVWAEMVREWTPGMARNQEQLCARTEEAWAALAQRPQYFYSLCDSMPRRIQKIINVQGSYLNY